MLLGLASSGGQATRGRDLFSFSAGLSRPRNEKSRSPRCSSSRPRFTPQPIYTVVLAFSLLPFFGVNVKLILAFNRLAWCFFRNACSALLRLPFAASAEYGPLAMLVRSSLLVGLGLS
jgi:hypothetical protein